MIKKVKSLFSFALLLMVFSFVSVSATNSSASGMATVTVGGFISLSISPGVITFGNMAPGELKNATNNPLLISIGSETNVAFVNITTKANQSVFWSGANTFSVGNMSWSNYSWVYPVTPYSMGEKTVFLTAVYGTNYSMYHQLTVPFGQASGAYNAGIIITAKDS
jgi:GTP-dependent phosphoenolpyruvate carboxykinase